MLRPRFPLVRWSMPLRDLLLNRALERLHDPALDFLKTLLEDVRQALIAEVVDLVTFRFDAWGTSLAARRLAQLRQASPTGIRIGAYGWVEDLRRGPPMQAVDNPPVGITGPLYRSEANKGYVQAPSLAHAATAAVLRSGYLSQQRESESGESPFAVDLSSDRVHRAKWMLDGVREGQSLGALLGYRFERGLHERGLDRYIHRFRTLASLKEEDALAQAQDKVAQAEQLARAVSALYAQRDQATQSANDARAVKAEKEATQRTYQAEIDAINALEQQAAAADARVAQANRAISQYQQTRPRSRVNKPGGNRVNVDLIEEQDLDQWTDGLVQLNAEKAEAVADASAARAQLAARAGSRAIAQAQIAKLLDPGNPESIPALQQVVNAQDAAAAQFDRQGLEQEGGTRGKSEADLAAARAALAALLNQQWDRALESLAANNVVDGLELHRRWKAGRERKPPQPQWDATTIPFGDATLGFPAPGSDDFKALDAQLLALDEMVDAVGDTVVAESVYQIVQGNPLRSGATLDAIATGEISPPELEVVRTPRTGVGLTHRLCTLFSVAGWRGTGDVADEHRSGTRPGGTDPQCLGGDAPATTRACPLQGRLCQSQRQQRLPVGRSGSHGAGTVPARCHFHGRGQ